MHDLFIRGLTLNGHLRPTQPEAPDLYKQPNLAWIPTEWETRMEMTWFRTTDPSSDGILHTRDTWIPRKCSVCRGEGIDIWQCGREWPSE